MVEVNDKIVHRKKRKTKKHMFFLCVCFFWLVLLMPATAGTSQLLLSALSPVKISETATSGFVTAATLRVGIRVVFIKVVYYSYKTSIPVYL